MTALQRQAGFAVACLLACACLLAVLPTAASAQEARERRSDVIIRTNAEFDAAHGVRSGSGTAADPYVISGWDVRNITIKDTSRHVTIVDNTIRGTLVLDWIGGGTQVYDNEISDLRVNQNVVRTGMPTSGVIAHNTFGVVGQLRHFDGIFEHNTVGSPQVGDADKVAGEVLVDRAVNFDGFNGARFRNNTIFGNNAVNNGPFSGIGVYSEIDPDHPRQTSGVSTGNVIDSNTVVDNRISRTGGVADTDNDGIRIEPGSIGNTIINNRVSGNGLDGIAIFPRSTDNVIRHNLSTGNGFRASARRGDGIRVFATANRTVIEHNQSTRNGDHGIIVGSQDNRIVLNTAVYNRRLPPLNANNPPFDLRDQHPTCDNNLWQDNRYGTVNPPCAGDTP